MLVMDLNNGLFAGHNEMRAARKLFLAIFAFDFAQDLQMRLRLKHKLLQEVLASKFGICYNTPSVVPLYSHMCDAPNKVLILWSLKHPIALQGSLFLRRYRSSRFPIAFDRKLHGLGSVSNFHVRRFIPTFDPFLVYKLKYTAIKT